ncbi:MAG: TAXI family TRAP transporter solute-binding subunit [Proteobacteria bacterium]|nr:TAXI family TRAP transporter solute-binding subunit [Pseudomonadota bacterium]
MAQDRTVVLLGTATPGGGFPVYGAAFAATVNEAEPSLRVETQNTRGSGENIPLLEAGKLDLGLVQGESAHEAVYGIGRKKADLRIVAAMYSSPGLFVVRADSHAKTIRDLVGKPIAFGAKSSGLVILSRYVLDGIGLDQDKDFQAVYLERAGDGPPMALDGRVAALWGGGIGWPGFMAMARSPGGARFIAPDAKEIRRILAKHAFLKPLTVPAGSFPGQDAAIHSVGSWSFVMASPALPDAVAYKLMRAVHRGEAALAKRLPAAAETTAANTYSAAPTKDLIHPGALRYLREIGIAQ